MQLLDEVLKSCEAVHGHMCAGQLLGARMALLGCAAIGLNDPQGADRKKLIVWVEIDISHLTLPLKTPLQARATELRGF